MNEIFENIKAMLPMSLVLSSYGIKVNRGSFCLCPFHSENHASCKVYDDRYLHCYGCSEHHDVISFTAKFFSLNNQYDAVKKLNQDFHLGLDTDTSLLSAEKSEYIKRTEEKKSYAVWEQNAWETLRNWYKLLIYFQEEYKPSCPEEFNDKFAMALTELPLAEIYLEEYAEADYEDRKTLFSPIIESVSARLNTYSK